MTITTNCKRLEVLLLCLLLGSYLLPWQMYGREPDERPPEGVQIYKYEAVTGLGLTVDLGRAAVGRWRIATYREGEGLVRAHPDDAWANTLAALSHALPVLLAIVALPEALLLKRRPTLTLIVTGAGLLVFSAANLVLAFTPGVIFRGVEPPGRAIVHEAAWWAGPLVCLLLAAALCYLWSRPLVKTGTSPDDDADEPAPA